MKEIKAILRVVGSLWFATTLLLALMLAMGSATIFESTRGAEQTKAAFYMSPWFKGLEWMLAINILAAMFQRFPFKKKLIPFYMAHVGIVVTLLGALITEHKGIDGRMSIGVGSKSNQYLVTDDTLALTNPQSKTDVEISIRENLGSRLNKKVLPKQTELSLDDVHVRVLRYWPDMTMERRFDNESKEEQTALQISIGKEEQIWLLAGRRQFAGGVHASVIQYTDEDAFKGAISQIQSESTDATVDATLNGKTQSIPMSAAVKGPVAFGESGYAFRILRYLPNARLGEDGKIVNVSDRPVNPAVEVEITSGETKVRRLLFSNFPEFIPKTNQPGLEEFKLTFKSGEAGPAHAPIEFHVSPTGRVSVRMEVAGKKPVFVPLLVDTPVETPWEGKSLTLHQRYDHARQYMEPVMPDPIRKERQPAVEVELTTPEGTEKQWISKYSQKQINRPNGTYLLLAYREQSSELGFSVILKDFQVGYYPGGRRPRTFQSYVVFEDLETGVQDHALISMNKPGKYRGYTFYQSSYNMGGKTVTSILSVAKDPGIPVVYLGYLLTTGGILALIIMGMLKAKVSGPPTDDEETKDAKDA